MGASAGRGAATFRLAPRAEAWMIGRAALASNPEVPLSERRVVIPVSNLGMYDAPWLQAANDALWRAVASRLRAAGLPGVPEGLDRGRPLAVLWQDPALLLGHTCGYPLVTALRDAVAVVARPLYDLPGCAGGLHRSFVTVRADAPFRSLAELRGSRAAVNNWDSNSGMNVFRHAVAPLAEGGRFFGAVVETGGHVASAAALQRGEVDAAAIDCVTFGLAARHRPEAVAGLRVLAETAASPVLPFVTAAGAAPDAVLALRAALAGAIRDPANADSVAALGLRGVEAASFEDYDVVLDHEREAVRLGYPVLA